MKKVIQGTFATSHGVQQQRVTFDEISEVILEISAPNNLPADYSFDQDCLIFMSPGDVHIHAREDASGKHKYKEDFASASLAAINGGLTHLCDMPNNPEAPINDESYLKKLSLAAKALVPIFPYAGIGPETKPLSFKVPYKAYMGPSVGDLFFKTLDDLDRVLENYRGQWVSFHCEDPEILESHKGASGHLARRPVDAEVVATKAALNFIRKHELKGKLCHYSAGEGLPLILEAKKAGVQVTCEVTPQHLYFSSENIPKEREIYFQMNPPIRHESDRTALLKALKNGDIDFLATDHAPHSKEEKEKGTSGLTGLDTYGPFMTWLLLEQKVTPQILAKIVAENPGQFVSEFLPTFKQHHDRYHKFGTGPGFLKIGAWASFSILDLKTPVTISKEMLKTKCGHSPFEGIQFPGSVRQLVLGGKRF